MSPINLAAFGVIEPWRVVKGDMRSVIARQIAPGSVDSIVTDPPYGLSKEPDIAEVLQHWLRGDDYQHGSGGFMGKSWDSFVPGPSYWKACYDALKPGGHLVAFGGTRTYDLMVIAIRLAGFEIRDQLQWLYGSGFPKSLNVSKVIDKAAGAERAVVAPPPYTRGRAGQAYSDTRRVSYDYDPQPLTAPATPEAERWEGWGTSLKPAHEPVVLARKPLIGTVAGNVLTHDTGALNVDACRIATTDSLGGGAELDVQSDKPEGWDRPWRNDPEAQAAHAARVRANVQRSEALGRWPANVLLDPEAAAMLDDHTGDRPGCRNPSNARPSSIYRPAQGGYQAQGPIYADTGGASRFFYCAKAASSERSAGLPEGLKNNHSTVKPINLMRWLCRLVTPPDGFVLDPFCGSGSTGCAAAAERFEFFGIELDEDPNVPAIEIARYRIAHWAA